MAGGAQPFVSIVGGLWMDKPDAFNAAVGTAREIGAALAKAGMGLVTYSSGGKSLEPHVVSGYVDALAPGAGAGSIRVRFAESHADEVKFPEQAKRGELFKIVSFPSNQWEAPFYRSLAAGEGVDAALLLGGQRSTLIAGQIALARKLPILAIDKYGGSAALIRTELAMDDEDYPSLSTHSPTQMVAWLKERCDAQSIRRAAAARREQQSQKSVTQRERALWAAGAFLALLTTFFFALGRPPEPGLYAFLTLAGLVAAGAMGALVRAVIWGAEETEPLTSLILGAVAGFAAGLAYLVPQYVGKYGVLDPAATRVEATDKIQFVSAALVAISAGVGFDTVFSRLRKQAEDDPGKTPARKTR